MVAWNGVKDEETLMKYLEKGLISNTVEMVLACEDSHSSECSCPYDFCCESIRSTVLTVRLKREFYEAIERGDKLVEYRDATPYWEARIPGKKFVRFFLGYPRTELDVKPIIRLIEKVVLVADQYHIHLVNPSTCVYVIKTPKLLGETVESSEGLTSTTTIKKYEGSKAVSE